MAAVLVDGIRSVPDEGLGRQVQVPGPCDGPIASADASEQHVVRAQPIEDGAPQQVLDVAFDDGVVSQGEAKATIFQRDDGSNAREHRRMLPQRSDPPQR